MFNTKVPMGNKVTAISLIGIIAAAVFAAFIILNPAPAAASRGDTHASDRGAFAFDIIDMVNKRLCERKKALGGRLGIYLIHPSKCEQKPPPPPEEPTVALEAEPDTIEAGGSSTLSWDAENADSCEAIGGWSDSTDTSGEEIVSPEETTTYTIACEGAGGEASASATVTVEDEQEPEAPTVEIDADPETITEGAASTLTWSSENADSCTGDWGSATAVDGSEVVSPSVTTTYTIECTGEGGTVDASVTVTVNPDEPEMGTLIVRKVVIRDNGGTTATTSFSFQIDNGGAVAFDEDGEISTQVNAGTHSVTEVAASGWTTSLQNCTDVDVAEGETEICTITNDDSAEAPATGTLIVRKVVVRDDGGTTATTSFSFQIDGGTAESFEADGENSVTVDAGTHSVTEPAVSGWTTTLDSNCTNVAVAAGETETCVITNNDVASVPQPTVSISATPTTVFEGSVNNATTTLEWDSQNATSCTASNAWSDPIDVDGILVVTPTQTSTYAIQCVGAGGTTTDSVIVNFEPEDPGPTEDHLLISEVYYDVNSTTTAEGRGVEGANEWIELHNPTNADVVLTNWWIGDVATTSAGLDKIPDGTTIQAGGFLVITASSTTSSLWDDVPMIVVDNDLGGSGLSNGGDQVVLVNANSGTTTVDAVSWGTNGVAFSPSITGLVADNSLFRTSLLDDTDTAADWGKDPTPTPGE